MIYHLKQIKQLGDVVEMTHEHAMDEIYSCSNEEERMELMEELLDEFFNIETTKEVRADLLVLARKGHVVSIENKKYVCFTVIPNAQYEFIIDGESMWYEGSLEELDNLEQLT